MHFGHPVLGLVSRERCQTVQEEADDAQCVDIYRCLRQLSVQRFTPTEAVSSAAHTYTHAELRTPPAAAEPRAGDAACRAGRARTLSHPRIRTCAGGSRRGERATPYADAVAPTDDPLRQVWVGAGR